MNWGTALHSDSRKIGLLAFAAIYGMACAPAVAAATLQLSTGIEYSSGNYGETTSTTALVVPFSAKVSFGSLALRASVPYLNLRGPANVAPIIEGDDGGGGSSGSGSNSGSGSSGSGSSDDTFAANRDVRGMGDASLSATWSFNRIASTALYVDVTGRMRLPTGDQSVGLGNGATDFVAQTEIGWDGRKGGIFISGGRRFLEDTPTVARVDGWQASAGYWRNIGKISVFGVQGNWRKASIAGAPDPQSVDMFLTRRLSTGWKLEVSGSAGLSNASPDYAAGLNFIWRASNRR
jgi:hypothetical protein